MHVEVEEIRTEPQLCFDASKYRTRTIKDEILLTQVILVTCALNGGQNKDI